jgi:hypothetical protein
MSGCIDYRYLSSFKSMAIRAIRGQDESTNLLDREIGDDVADFRMPSIGDMTKTGVIREAMVETARFCVLPSGSLISF